MEHHQTALSDPYGTGSSPRAQAGAVSALTPPPSRPRSALCLCLYSTSGHFWKFLLHKACTPAELPNCHPLRPTDGSMPTGLLLQANLSCCRGAEERRSLPQHGQGWSAHAAGALPGFHRNCHRVRKGPVPPHRCQNPQNNNEQGTS